MADIDTEVLIGEVEQRPNLWMSQNTFVNDSECDDFGK